MTRDELIAAGAKPVSTQVSNSRLTKEQLLKMGAKPAVQDAPTSAALAPKPQGAIGLPGFATGVVKGVGSTLAGAEKLGGKIIDAPLKLLGVNPLVEQGLFEQQKEKGSFTPTTTSQRVGFGAEQLAEMLAPVPGGAKARLATKALGAPSRILARGVLEASEIGAKTALQTGGEPKEVGRSAVIGGTFGALGGLLSKAATKAAPTLKASAEKSMTQALGPTTNATKRQAEKVVPGLIKRGFKGVSRSSLVQKAGSSLEKATEDLNRIIETIPPEARINARPILKVLQDSKAAYTVDNVVVEPRAVKAIDDMVNIIKEMGSKVSFGSMRSLRQILDKSVAKSNGFLMDEVGTFSVAAKKEASNAIRSELAKKFPDLAKVNAEYSFWKNVDDILEATMSRTTAQSKPLGEQLLGAAGVAGGLATGGITGAVTWGVALSGLRKAMTSAGWRTSSAALKNRLADALAANKFEEANVIIAKILAAGTTNRN